MDSLTFRTLSLLLIGTVVIGVCLAELYGAGWIDPPWLQAALVNSALALGVGVWCWLSPSRRSWLQGKPADFRGWSGYWFYLPGVLVPGICLVLALGSSWLVPTAKRLPLESYQWAWVFWIPLVEEVTFRLGISTGFRHFAGAFWGAYFAALLFALVHGSPTLSNMLEWNVGLPIGPFLLALCCEWLLANGRSLWPLVVFHIGCNATVVIFAWWDSRWLQWLGLFYH